MSIYRYGFEFYTVDEIVEARKLPQTRERIRRMCAEKQIEALKVANQWFICDAAIEKYFQGK
jgi:hypothetical protein